MTAPVRRAWALMSSSSRRRRRGASFDSSGARRARRPGPRDPGESRGSRPSPPRLTAATVAVGGSPSKLARDAPGSRRYDPAPWQGSTAVRGAWSGGSSVSRSRGRAGSRPSRAAAGRRPGEPQASLTDVAGVKVGHFTDTAPAHRLHGGAGRGRRRLRRGRARRRPGTRETDLLEPVNIVEQVHAVVLVRRQRLRPGRGHRRHALSRGEGARLRVGAARVPIVPAAILFDLDSGRPEDPPRRGGWLRGGAGRVGRPGRRRQRRGRRRRDGGEAVRRRRAP